MHKGEEFAVGRVVGHAFEAAVVLALGVFGWQGFFAQGASRKAGGHTSTHGHVALDQFAGGIKFVDGGAIFIAHPDVAILILNDRFQVSAVGVVGQQGAIGIHGQLVALAIGAAGDRRGAVLAGELHLAGDAHHAGGFVEGQLVEAGLVIRQQEGSDVVLNPVGAGSAIGL